MLQICASLLGADYARLGDEVRRAVRAGVDSFHFDMMDGHYVPNFALTPRHLSRLRAFTRLPFQVHFELSNPLEVLEGFQHLDADLVILQWETLDDPARVIRTARRLGLQVGLSLNPDEALEPALPFLADVDQLTLLAVHPGFGGQAMLPGMPEKVAAARAFAQAAGLSFVLAVDGGVKPDNAAALLKAGADCLILGTALFASRNMPALVNALRAAASG